MKVLSVVQPWAWLIVNGHKDVENRTWSTTHRGSLLIHASHQRSTAFSQPAYQLAERLGIDVPSPWDLPYGAIVGLCELVDIVTGVGLASPWAERDWAWLLRGAASLTTPIDCRGRLRLWDVPCQVAVAQNGRARLMYVSGPGSEPEVQG